MLRATPEPPKNTCPVKDNSQEETRQPSAQKRRNSLYSDNDKRTGESITATNAQRPKAATRGSPSPPPNSENTLANAPALKSNNREQTARSWPGFTSEYLVSFDPSHIVHSNESASIASNNVPHHLTNVPVLAEKTGTTILSYLGKYRQDVSFPCVLMHWANTLAKHHTVSRYSNSDAFHGMMPHEPMPTQWTYLEQNEWYTLGNGLVILGRSKYRRIMGLSGVAVRVEGMMFAGIREPPLKGKSAEKQADGSSKSKTESRPTLQYPDVAIIDSLPAATPVPFVMHQFDAPHRIGRDLVVQRGSVVDTDCVIHGPFVYKGIQFTNEDIIHADGVFARILGDCRTSKPAPKKITPTALKPSRENGRNVPKSPTHQIEELFYVEYCIDARLNDPMSPCYQGCQLSLPQSLKRTIPPTPNVCAPSTLECFGHFSETLPAGAIPALCFHPGYLSGVATCAERAVSPKGGYVTSTYPGPGFKRCQWCSLICGGLGELPYSYMLTCGSMLPAEVSPLPQLPTHPKPVASGHKVCGRCDVYYCNRECQLAHWQTHKRMCMVWKNYKKHSNMITSIGTVHQSSDQPQTPMASTDTIPLPNPLPEPKAGVQKSAQQSLPPSQSRIAGQPQKSAQQSLPPPQSRITGQPQKSAQQSLPPSQSSINGQPGTQDKTQTKRPQIDKRWISPVSNPNTSVTNSSEQPQAAPKQEKTQKVPSAQRTRGANKPAKPEK